MPDLLSRDQVEDVCRAQLEQLTGDRLTWDLLKRSSPNKAALIRILVVKSLESHGYRIAPLNPEVTHA